MGSSDDRLAGLVAVVTGGARGIGRAIALRLAGRGARVVIADIDPASGEETVAEIHRAGGEAAFVETDVSILEETVSLAQRVGDTYGHASILVNNAGIAVWAPLEETSSDLWERVLAVNLRSALFCTQAFLDQLRLTAGAIVNVASASALVGMKWQTAYAASKGGMVAMTRSMAVELGPAGIRVNAVCPGAVDTDIMDQALVEVPGSSREDLARLSPLRRYGTPEQIAGAVEYLASGDADFTTGSCLVVDGGMTAA